MYLPMPSSRIWPYSKQEEYCLTPEFRVGSVSASTSNLLYNCGENHWTSTLPTFSGWKMGWSLTYPARVMRMFSHQDLESSWRPDAVKEAMELHSSGHIFLLLPCHLRGARKKLVGSTEKKPRHMDSSNIAAKDSANCTWVGDPVLSPSEGDFFSWTLGGSLFCFQGSRVWMMCLTLGTTKKAIRERMMFLKIEKIVSVGELCFGCS